jgi:hypothetical protein
MNAKELRKLSMDELLVLHRSGLDTIEAETVQAEIRARISKEVDRPHWSTVPAFWISVVAAVAACIAAYPVLFSNKEDLTVQEQITTPPVEEPVVHAPSSAPQVKAGKLSNSK